MVQTKGWKVWIKDAKAAFQRHFEKQKMGAGTPWAERSDTYMYLAQMDGSLLPHRRKRRTYRTRNRVPVPLAAVYGYRGLLAGFEASDRHGESRPRPKRRKCSLHRV